MKVLRFYFLFFCLASVPRAFGAEYSDAFFAQKITAIERAEAERDFRALARDMHPYALTYYRRIVWDELDTAAVRYGRDQIRAATGIDVNVVALLNDQDFFVSLCQAVIAAKAKSAEAIRPVTVLGVIKDEPPNYVVVYRYRDLTEKEVADGIVVARPLHLTFRQSREGLKLWSILLGTSTVLEFRTRLKAGLGAGPVISAPVP